MAAGGFITDIDENDEIILENKPKKTYCSKNKYILVVLW